MNKLPTILQLKQLDIILDDMKLETESHLRIQEINNIQMVVRGAIYMITDPDGNELADSVISEMGARINHLVDNPDSAGNHNQFNNN